MACPGPQSLASTTLILHSSSGGPVPAWALVPQNFPSTSRAKGRGSRVRAEGKLTPHMGEPQQKACGHLWSPPGDLVGSLEEVGSHEAVFR